MMKAIVACYLVLDARPKRRAQANGIEVYHVAMDWQRCEIVETIPGKVSGVPLLRGSRVPAEQVVASHEAGESAEEIAYNYDLNLEDVRTVLSYSVGNKPIYRS